MNPIAIVVAALVPLAIGAVYYNPKVFGKAWMEASGLTEEQASSGNMILIFGLTLLFSFMLAFIMNPWGVHQNHVESLMVGSEGWGDPESENMQYVADFNEKYGDYHRTFTHGMVHGGVAAIFFALPFIAIGALFERRGWKYVAIHVGYWFIVLMLMCGIICAWQ